MPAPKPIDSTTKFLTISATAVTVQAMVFGNADQNSGLGVAFTRNPNDGQKALYGEYLIGRQGEDLVAGTHSSIDLSDPQRDASGASLGADGHRRQTRQRLYRDMVDIEFHRRVWTTLHVASPTG